MRFRTRVARAWAGLLVGFGLLGPAQALTSEPNGATLAPPSPPVQSAVPLGLGDLEEIALQRNPTLVQAAAAVDASRGKALQAGLCPNPTIGYRGPIISASPEAPASSRAASCSRRLSRRASCA